MNRNTEQHFSENPTTLDMPRSKFNREHTHKTTFNTGDIVPIFVDEVLPGDTFTVDTAAVVRMSTPIYPVMDNAYMDTYYFFVPARLVWEHFKEFMGENTTSKWEQTTEYQIPQITAPSGGWEKGTLADYMGIPTKVGGISINALPFRAYALIYNEWFRDQNLKDPAYINFDDATQTGSNGTNYITDIQLGGHPAKAAKYADYYTKALPAPQKGPTVTLPIGDNAPVRGTGMVMGFVDKNGANAGLAAGTTDGYLRLKTNAYGEQIGNYPSGTAQADSTIGLTTDPTKSGLVADLSNVAATTINQLRQAFAIQRWYEASARGGSRYRETIKAFFGVTSADARMQIPEYLGGNRYPINIQQVIQTSATDAVSPQGNTAAYSQTGFSENSFTKSFTEHGYILGLAVVRTDHTYQQGIERMWSRMDKFDFYWPTFANLGEQAVLNKEIYATGTSTDNEVFGYQEAWAEYRYKPARISGAFRSNYAQTLDSWHYGDYYTQQPILSSDWIDETRANVNRTIAVQDSLEDQFLADFYFRATAVRCMPVYSIPGLIDHH